jgi:Ca2+:H+ antiporter
LSAPQAIIIAALTLALYAVFLIMQTVRHQSFFLDPTESDDGALPATAHGDHSIGFHILCLVLTLTPAVYLTEQLGHIAEHAVEAAGAPAGLAGVVVAVLVLAPETMGALQAAMRNQLQRAVNISLGSVLATIGLTIPAVLILGVLRGTPTILGVDGEQMVLLAVSLVVAMLTFGGDRTNMLQGAVHLVMFLVFGLLLFHP